MLILICCLSFSGCIVGGTAIGQFDHHAAVMRGLADKENGSTIAQLQDPNAILSQAVIVENEARAAENFSSGLHMQGPRWPTPASRPGDMPWKPKDANGV
jgi:hypothetical protein